MSQAKTAYFGTKTITFEQGNPQIMTHRSLPSAMPGTNLTPGRPIALIRAMELLLSSMPWCGSLVHAVVRISRPCRGEALSSVLWCGSLVRAVVRVVRLAQSGKAPG